MRREDKKKLILNRRIIVGHLRDLEGVLDYLISKQIFTPSIRERIIYDNKVPPDRIRQMLDLLVSRNALSYQYFLESLILTDNIHIANILDPEYSTSEECRRMVQREQITLPPHSNTEASNQHFTHNNHHLNYNSSNPVLCSQLCTQNDFATPAQIRGPLRYSNSPLPLHICQESHSNFSSQGTSRSSSQSMSPITNRARSTSVTGFYNTRRNQNYAIGTSSSACFLSALNKRRSIEENPSVESTPIQVASCDENDQWSPRTNENLPSVYELDWNDVNSLELDFTVYGTMPNLRKELRHECYCMEKTPRGLCLIINNEHFYDEHGVENVALRRNGTNMDASRLKNLFEKLHFSVEMCIDVTERQMRSKISQFARESENNSAVYDCICLIILSHGTDGYVYTVDGDNRINLDRDVLNLFDDVMIGKPKLFIFQACRGETLNQKENPSINELATFSCNSNSDSPMSSNSSINGCTSRSCVRSKPPAPVQASSTLSTMSDEESLNKRFNKLKVSSSSAATPSNSLQMMFKKNSASSSSSSTISSKSKMKTRSRSHSRSKYSSYLASAATAIKTAIKTSPSASKANTLLQSISTQTCSSMSVSSHGSSSSSSIAANQYPESIIIPAVSNLMNFTDGRPIKTYIPSRSDFFIWYSSVRGYVSHRDSDGSPFIKCLVTVFSRCAYELELIEMVRKVNSLMQQYEKAHFNEKNAIAQYFMSPVAEYLLTKRLYFNP